MRLTKLSGKETSVINRERRSGQTKDLRRRTEEWVKEKQRSQGPGASEDSMTAKTTQRLVQELQIHQIELEMQNEELKLARSETEVALEKYTNLYDFAPVGYFTLGPDGTIRQANLNGARLVGIKRARLLNRRFASLVSETDRPAFNAFLQKIFTGKDCEFCEVTLSRERTFPLSIRIEAMVSKDGRECRAAVLDVTEHHRTVAERDLLIEKLKQTLVQVNLLSGLLPICSCCKKIRDDQGYWNQVETYISAHSEVIFTHGLCPECIAKLYPELSKTKEPAPWSKTGDRHTHAAHGESSNEAGGDSD